MNTLAGLDLGLDKGADSVNGEEHEDREEETGKEVEAGASQLGTDGLDAHLGDGSRTHDAGELVLVATTDLTPFAGRIDDRVLEANAKSIQWVT